jgi:hypothetical protein
VNRPKNNGPMPVRVSLTTEAERMRRWERDGGCLHLAKGLWICSRHPLRVKVGALDACEQDRKAPAR